MDSQKEKEITSVKQTNKQIPQDNLFSQLVLQAPFIGYLLCTGHKSYLIKYTLKCYDAHGTIPRLQMRKRSPSKQKTKNRHAQGHTGSKVQNSHSDPGLPDSRAHALPKCCLPRSATNSPEFLQEYSSYH